MNLPDTSATRPGQRCRRAIGIGVSRRGWRWLAALLGALASSGHQSTRGQPPPSVSGERASAVASPACWDRVDAELEHVVLWVSHILIRHDGAEADPVSFCLADWVSPPPPVSRSREQALRLARDIMRRARGQEETFERLAERHSEDETTRARGGSLGGVSASMLLPWPEVLDALAATAQGGVSDVVETRYGFHVFLRRPPPVAAKISGAHIVMGHAEARWLRHFAVAQATLRSRAEALARAREVVQLARREPARFDELVARYSDHPDAAWGGDLGEWSSLEPTPFPREIDVLAGLREHEISEPVETLFGIQVLMRTPPRPRQAYAMAAVRIAFDPAREAPDLLSKPAQQAGARALLDTLTGDPERFEQAQRMLNGRSRVERWTEGRAPLALERSLHEVGFGALVAEPIERDGAFLIVKRLDPAFAPVTPVRFELPNAPTRAGRCCTGEGERADRCCARCGEERPGETGPL